MKRHICFCEVSRVAFWVHEAELRPLEECEEGTALLKAGQPPEAGATLQGLTESAPAKFPFPSLCLSLLRSLFQFTCADIDMLEPAT